MARSTEPLWWSLFSAGGVVAAFFFPATMILTGLAVPAGWLSPDELHALVQQPPVRLTLFVLISLPLFHWAHRTYHLGLDLGLRQAKRLLAIGCYGAAIAGTLAAAIVAVAA